MTRAVLCALVFFLTAESVMASPWDTWVREAVEREMQREPAAKLPAPWVSDTPPPAPTTTISPGALHTLGGLADAASTYYFLKARPQTSREGNPLLNPTGGHPAATAAGALIGLLATKAGVGLLRKLSPAAADAVAANIGAEQLGLAVNNVQPQGSSFSRYGEAMVRHRIGK